MKKINIGIIGAGKISEEYIKVCKLKSDQIKIQGIIGKNSKKSEILAKKYSIKFYDNDIDRFLKLKIDIIIVAVNITSVHSIAKKLKNFPNLILFEKPLGKNHEESKLILNCLKNKKNCFVALNRRFYDNFQNAFRYLKNDNSKKIITVFDQQDLNVAKKIGHPKTVIKNWMYANSIHLIDILIFFGQGKVNKIITEKHNFKKEKFIFSKIYFNNGNLGFYNSIWNRPGPWSVNISSSKYFFEFNPLEKLEMRFNSSVNKRIIMNEKKETKPGFFGQINELIKIFRLKKSLKSVSFKKNNFSSLPNIEEYLRLSAIVKKIYNI